MKIQDNLTEDTVQKDKEKNNSRINSVKKTTVLSNTVAKNALKVALTRLRPIINNMMIEYLRKQHTEDLRIYRMNHTNIRNRILHWCMIPIETFSFLLFLATILLYFFSFSKKKNRKMTTKTADFSMTGIGWSIGLTSLAVAESEQRLLVGSASLVFHVAACSWALRLVKATTSSSHATTTTQATSFHCVYGHLRG